MALRISSSFFFTAFLMVIGAMRLSGQTEHPPADSFYHYSVCFPADVKTRCTSDPAIPTVTYRERGCDLLAVSSEDKFFQATVDSACYKILRTYRVISWCEYDGEAAPVIIERDWDGWNGVNPGRCGRPAPAGDGAPGDEGICITVFRDLRDALPDTVWYDSDLDPFNNSPDDPSTPGVEGYWWKVASGGTDTRLESYYEANCSSWGYDNDPTDTVISNNLRDLDRNSRFGSFGFWEYTQHIIVYDDLPPSVSIAGRDTIPMKAESDCMAEVTFHISVADTCSSHPDLGVRLFLDNGNDGVIDGEVTGDLLNGRYRTRLGLGAYRLVARAFDGCGNSAETSRTFVVVDSAAPAPICIDALSVELADDPDSTGLAAVWASDFVASPVYDCRGQDPSTRDAQGRPAVTRFSINRVGEEADSTRDHLLFSCADAGRQVLVEVHAWDAAGNHDFCQTQVLVQDNQLVCVPPPGITGKITTEEGMPLANVEVQLAGAVDTVLLTDAAGVFSAPDITPDQEISIIPRLHDQIMNGLTTLDLILMQKHNLGVDPLNSPYKVIAADVDNSGRINILDMIFLRKVLLGIYSSFRNNQIWRFVPADLVFDDPMQPWSQLPASMNMVAGDDPDTIRMIGIKVGDLDGNRMMPSAVTLRAPAQQQLVMEDRNLLPGREYSLPVFWDAGHDASGIQFALQADPAVATIKTVQYEQWNASNLAVFPTEGVVRGVWTQADGQTDERPLFYLVLTVGRPTALSEVLTFSNRPLRPGVFSRSGQEETLHLTFSRPQPALRIGPNPFSHSVTISLDLDQAETVICTIHDALGRRLRIMELAGITGENVWELPAHSFAEKPGVYVVTLETSDGKQSRRLFRSE